MRATIGRRFHLCSATLLAISCGGAPAGPNGSASTPVPATTAVPTARPTATPPPCVATGSCEAPTLNTNPPTRIEIRMYQVRKPNGDAAPCLGEDPVAPGNPLDEPNTRYWFAPVAVGYTVKLDATAFDRFSKPTNSDCLNEKGEENRGCITWRFGHGEHLIENYSLGHLFQPTFKVAGPGDFQIQAEMYNEGNRVRSAWYWLNFTDNPGESPCAR